MAEILGVTSRSLRDWPDCPRNDDGTYTAKAVVAWYVQRQSGSSLNFNAERARLTKAQADKTEMEVAVRGGDLLERSRVMREVGAMLASFQSRVIAIPDAIGQLFEPKTARTVVAELRRKLHEALAELAEYRPGVSDGPGADRGASAESDGERVGGSEPQALKRKQRGARAMAN